MPTERRTGVERPLDNPGPYEAVVVNHLDPKFMGGLQVELLKSSGSGNQPQRSGQIITVRYMNPFYGTTPLNGNNRNDSYQTTQKSYGFWFVPPDVGSRVLVIFAEGNMSRGFWIGCVQDEFMNFMIPEPRVTTKFNTTDNNRKLPVGEYNKFITNPTDREPTRYPKPVNQDFANRLAAQGLIDDEVRGLTSSSSRREAPSNVYGISTPGPLDKRNGAPSTPQGPHEGTANIPSSRLGGSSLVFDDGDDKLIRRGHPKDSPMEYSNVRNGEEGDRSIPHNECVRLRTRTGHQILLHNSEDLIYIANGRGTSWIEMTSNGKIDIYAADSVSVHSSNDLNFTAARDINLTASKDFNLVAETVRVNSSLTTNFVAGKDWAVSSGTNVSLNAQENFIAYANGDLETAAQGQTSILSADHLAIGSTTSVGIEGCGHIRLTTDGEYDLKALGNIKVETKAELSQISSLATKIQSGNAIGVKAVGSILVNSEATIGMKSTSDTQIKSDANVDIQGAEPAAPPEPANAIIPAAPNVFDPTPPEVAFATTRVPQIEPWFEHEHINPAEYTPEKTRAGGQTGESYPPATPDTFNRGPGGTFAQSGSQPSFYNSSGAGVEGSTGYSSQGAASIPPDPPAVEIEKKALTRIFAQKLREIAGFNTDEIFAAIACAETESGLQLKSERGYGGTSNERIRSIFRGARQVSDAELTTIKQDDPQFFELVYGPGNSTGRGLGNTTPGDGAKFIGRGLIQLTGKANHQRYGKLAGLIDETLIQDESDPTQNDPAKEAYNPFAVTIVEDPTVLLTDVETSCAVCAAYLGERYRDLGKPDIVGNMRMAIAGTARGYDLGRPKDLGYLENKKNADGTWDMSWIESPNPDSYDPRLG